MIRTSLTRWFDLHAPVLGAPMAGVAGGELARAVSLGGGLGMIGVGQATTPQWIAEQARVPDEAEVSFGIGLMAWVLADRPELLAAAIAASPVLVSVSFGDPEPFVGPLHDAGIAVAAQVNTLADVERATAAGVDVLVAQGTEAGGHTGRRATLPLLQEVLAATDRPVVAAGGVATGAGMAGVLVAGAAGVWVGTPLLSCPEAMNTPAARERVRAARGEDTVLTRAFDIAQGVPWPERWAGRALTNEFTRAWAGREDALRGDTAAQEQVRAARRSGDVEHAPLYAGEAVGLVTAEESATDVVRRLSADAEAVLRRVPRLLSAGD
ncbi:nitronate monooxygenase [Modestobacter sp. I12A-02628]|uniref:Nitronate monooxygenase n=1 Tax=Goekera deserti TaxID=2497753 RepID=A0A7K3WAV4_9ACTN|nr:nitronate monooxygenase [Goekera deserti]MPQ98833.1 nitronate monooxygenase [Goekera deserti]NDI49668.1 nitronate monooxygenase [Goekera deserti]NEL53139.1 nitronate monooxygenase [Goekera deserti]